MKAVYCPQYGGPEVLEIREVKRPQPGADEILIRNYAASATAADTFFRMGKPRLARLFFGIRKPKNPLMGTGFAGEIIAIGENIQDFDIGDRVCGETGVQFAASAQFIALDPAKAVVQPLPPGLSFVEAAPLCDGMVTSWNFLLEVAKITPGQSILINGASGSLGVAAVQIASNHGAIVTAVCSQKNHALVLKLGADEVIDYHSDDFTENLGAYDVIFDTLAKRTFRECKKALKPRGQYLSPVLNGPTMWAALTSSLFGRKKARFSATGLQKPEILNRFLAEILAQCEKGALKSIIERTFPMREVQKAHQHLDSGRKVGNIVLEIPQEN